MKLSEIRAHFEALLSQEVETPKNGREIEQHLRDLWDDLPRVPYSELPASLQKNVRNITPEGLRDFLEECYKATPGQFETLIAGIPENTLNQLLIRTRNTAIYTIEGGYFIYQADGYTIMELSDDGEKLLTTPKDLEYKPALYGNYATEAFEAVLQQYRNPAQRQKVQQPPELTAIDKAPLMFAKYPASPLTYTLARVLNAGAKGPTSSRSNRHEHIEVQYSTEQRAAQYTRKANGKEYTVTVYDPEKTLKGSGKILGKLFFFMLQRWALSGYGREFSFPLQELVDLGMYQSLDTARVGVKTFMGRQALIQLSQIVTVGKGKNRHNKNAGGVVFYNFSFDNNYVTISVNEKMPMPLLANFFTLLPMFAYGLSANAFWIVHYIMYLARQNGKILRSNDGTFTIKIDSVRQFLELPAPADVRNFKYREKIQEPIEKAIEEIETAIYNATQEGEQDFTFTITPVYDDDSSIEAWLNGKLSIQIPHEQAATFIEITEREEEHYRKRERERIKAEEKVKAEAAATPAQE